VARKGGSDAHKTRPSTAETKMILKAQTLAKQSAAVGGEAGYRDGKETWAAKGGRR